MLTAVIVCGRIFIPIFIDEVISLSQIVISVHKALVVNSQLKFFSMLRKVQVVRANLHVVAKKRFQGFFLVDDCAISVKSFLPTHY